MGRGVEQTSGSFKDRLPAINLWLSIEGRYDVIMDNAEPDNEYIIDAYGKKFAAELAARYRAMYPRRTAMIDELKNF